MSIRRVPWFLFLAGCLAFSACGPGLPALDPNAGLTEVSGLVEIQNPGQAAFGAAADGFQLQVLGQVRTGMDGRLRLDLSSGTIIRVGPESLLTLRSNTTAADGLLTSLVLEAGQVWVILDGGSLEIQTPSGTASVRGSFMSVRIDPLTADVKVDCLEGSCQAGNDLTKTDLLAGQACTLFASNPDGNTPPPPPQAGLLTQEEIDLFLANNPEAAAVMESMHATSTALPPGLPAATSTPPAACFELGLPADGSQISPSDPTSFDWADQPGAYKYILTLVKPNGAQKTRLAWESGLSLEPADLPVPGSYSWQVTAYDSNYRPICSAGPWTFTRPAAPVPTSAGECFHLTAPADGSQLPASGPVTFSWEEQPGRFKYIFNLISPSGNEMTPKVFTTDYTRNLEDHPAEGTYTWLVTAYDSGYRPICTAGPWTFSKPASGAPTSAPGNCVSLLTPADGAAFSGANRVDFTWSAYPGAYKYIITFKPPSTPAYTFLAWEPLHTRFIESFPEAGAYQWWVTVKDSNLNAMCTSQAFTFSKDDTSYLYPSDPGGSGSFWGQYGPTGAQASCSLLNFGVSTSAEGMIKIIYSFSNPSPDGNTDPHIVIGNGPGSGAAGVSDFSGHSGVVYYRFGVFNGSYTHDSLTFSFTCP